MLIWHKRFTDGYVEEALKVNVAVKAGEQPVSLVMYSEPDKRGLAISEALMQNIKSNGHESFLDGEQELCVESREWYDVIMMPEERDAIEQWNEHLQDKQKNEKNNESKKENKPKKESKPIDYFGDIF